MSRCIASKRPLLSIIAPVRLSSTICKHYSISSRHRTNAFIFDIDGVLLHDSHPIPSAAESLHHLHENLIPFVFLTNNGGILESDRIQQVQKHLGLSERIPLRADQLVMSHTPMCHAVKAHNLERSKVLVCGHGNIKDVARSIGLRECITVEEFLRHNRDMYPLWGKYEQDVLKREVEPVELDADGLPPLHHSKVRFEAVFVLHDPFYMMRDLQVIMDVLTSNGVVGHPAEDGRQHIPLYMSNPDFLYANRFPMPRFGQGAFKTCLEATYSQITGGQKLQVIQYGKPERKVYEFALQRLTQLAQEMGFHDGVEHVFCVGDNPAADIQGANNAGDHFTSVLVRTGVFKEGENDALYPGDVVVDKVGDFVLTNMYERV